MRAADLKRSSDNGNRGSLSIRIGLFPFRLRSPLLLVYQTIRKKTPRTLGKDPVSLGVLAKNR